MNEYEIRSIVFDDEGLVLQYMSATDVRAKGSLLHTHTLHLAMGHPDYREDSENLHAKAVRVLKNALEDFNDSEPFVAADEDDDELELGMGER